MNKFNNSSSQENLAQTYSTKQKSILPRWLNIVFKAWAIIGFLATGVGIIMTTYSLLFSTKVFTQLLEIPVLYFLIAYSIAFKLILISLIPFWGILKFRKWVLPILFVWSFFSIVNILAIVFKQPIQWSTISVILGSVMVIIITLLAFIFRHNFIGSFRKLIFQITFFVFAIPVLFFGSLSLLFPDLSKINDSDLILEDIISLPKEENVYFLLEKLNEQIYKPADEARDSYLQFLEGKAWDQTEVDFILNKNKKALERMRQITTFSHYQCPTITNTTISFATIICPTSYLRQSARIASLSALSKARKGDYEEAIEDALIPMHIGHLLIQAPLPTLIDYLVGTAIMRDGLKNIQIILATNKIPSEILLSRITRIKKYTKNEESLKKIFKLKYLAWKNDLVFVNKINSNFYIQPNKFFTEIAENTRQNIKLTDTPCYQLGPAIKEYLKDFNKGNLKFVTWKLLFTRNAVFEVIKSILLAGMPNVQEKRCESDLLVEQTRFQMALESYKYDNGKYPLSQSELIPNYIIKPVLNPLTNNKFLFNKNTGVLIIPD